MSIRELTNLNYPTVKGVYDEGSLLYYPNYYDDPQLFAETGWDNSTALTIVQVEAFHDGNLIFVTDSDEPTNDFKWVVYDSTVVFTAQDKIDLKVYVSKVPPLKYDDILIIGQSDLSLDGPNYFYDANVIVYNNEIYQTSFTYRMLFAPDDFGVKNFSIPYTDSDTGESAVNLSVDVTYQAVAKPWEKVATVAFDFDSATLAMPNYINTIDGQTLTPTQGPIYSNPAVPSGQGVVFEQNMKILNPNEGNVTTWAGTHIAYPYGNKNHGIRCINNWDNSGLEGYFDLHGKWSIEFSVCDMVSQSDWALINEQKNRDEQYVYVENSTNGGVPILDVQTRILSAWEQSTAKILINGVEITLPALGSDGYRKRKMFLCYSYDSDLDRGNYIIDSVGTQDNERLQSTGFIASPPNIACDTDVKLGGGWTGSAYEASYGKGIYNFVYYNNYEIDVANDHWLTSKSHYFKTSLQLGDSWTRGQNVSPDTEGYSNRFLQSAVNAGYKYFSMTTHFAPDYNDTCTSTYPDPSWQIGSVDRPSVGSLKEFDRILDLYVYPDTCTLAYTGINYGLKLAVNKPGNPSWGSVPWSTPIYFAQWHESELNSRGIPFLTWDSSPANLLMDRAPSETDLIDRAKDLTWGWAQFFTGKTLEMYDVSVDPLNAGYIDPLKNLGDDAHVNENPGYYDIGDYLWTNGASVLVPNYTP